MKRRRFSKAEKQAAEIVGDAQGDADHIVPYSKGGETAVENCQILPPSANRKKGAFKFVPRKWQSEFLEKWDQRDEGIPFMLIAIPGSGKTMAALEAVRRWRAAGPDRRVIVVVPTANLRQQWRDEAQKFGMDLQTKDFGTNYKDGFMGGVVTYHLVACNPAQFRKLCAVAPTMVIFDEIHHCGEESQWGEGIKAAFELVREKLSMSGTPWKSDGKPIPFVRYDGGGYAIGDIRYDYPDALNDVVVRPLVFDYSKGSITNDITGESDDLDQTVSDEAAAFRLSRILNPSGDYVKQHISDAHRKLTECRKTVPDAGALALCIDQQHAIKVAAIIRSVTKCQPSIIVSDDKLENDSVDGFRRSNKEWLVAVRKVSEGTDIKRLQVLCYLTNITSDLFFRQVVGRVSRVRRMEDHEGYVYLPADPRLIRCAKNIEDAQIQAATEQLDRDVREIERDPVQPDFATYSTTHDGTDVVLIAGEPVPIDEAKEIERIAEATKTPMQKVREISLLLHAPAQPPSADTSEPPKEDRMDDLRRKCSRAAFRLSKIKGCEVKEIHGKFKPQAQMGEEELSSKFRFLVEEARRVSK